FCAKIVAVEYVMKWAEAQALFDCSAESIAAFLLKDIIYQHGCLQKILTDQGTHFYNKVMEVVCKKAGIQHKLSSIREVTLPVDLIIDTYPVEDMSNKHYDALLLARALRMVDNLFEAWIKACENI
ncbi:4837_t:CDS:2, partial [Gigaspora margarita]